MLMHEFKRNTYLCELSQMSRSEFIYSSCNLRRREFSLKKEMFGNIKITHFHAIALCHNFHKLVINRMKYFFEDFDSNKA